MNILESQSFRKRGVLIKSTIEFNENDEREYLDMVNEIEDAIISVLDRRGHTLLVGSSKGLTAKELE